jgi:hypothetical protein
MPGATPGKLRPKEPVAWVGCPENLVLAGYATSFSKFAPPIPKTLLSMCTPMTDVLITSPSDWIPVFRSRIAELGLTHLAVDGAAGLSEGHTSKILWGLRKPTAETIARLCEALELVQVVKQKIAADGRASFEEISEHADIVVNKTGDVDGDTADQFPSEARGRGRVEGARRAGAPAAEPACCQFDRGRLGGGPSSGGAA